MAEKTKKLKTFAVVNPSSAAGVTIKKWPETSEKLELAIGRFDYEFTNASGVATMLASEALKAGYGQIISVGGDGTLHEVLQGLFSGRELIDPDVVVGIIPFGSGADFAKTIRIHNDIDEAILKIKHGVLKKIDVGVATFKNHQDKTAERFFMNMADAGLGGEVAQRVNSSMKTFGGFASYLFASISSFTSWKPKRVKIKWDEGDMEETIVSVIVANGQYCGGGMWIAPEAKLDDGLFDVIVIGNLPKWSFISYAPKLYSGGLISSPGISHFRTSYVSVESKDDIFVNLDGEQPGTTPVQFKVLPRVLNFIVGPKN